MLLPHPPKKIKNLEWEAAGWIQAGPSEGEGVGFMVGIRCHEVIVKLHVQTEVCCHCVGPYLLMLCQYSVDRSMYV
jgi:hypothetical protein